jgi:hypothetical protein
MSKTTKATKTPENGAAAAAAGPLSKRHATLHTASIDIQIMRLDRKQVTMAVFRQLDEESVFLADGSLRGTPWGRVNYTWNANRPGTAFHVVWQDGECLKRSQVPKPDHYEWWRWLWDEDEGAELDAEDDWYRERLRAVADTTKGLGDRLREVREGPGRGKAMVGGPWRPLWTAGDRHPWLWLWEDLAAAGLGTLKQDTPYTRNWVFQIQPNVEALERVASHVAEVGHALRAQHNEVNAALARMRDAFAKRVEEMKQLDLLFIAV